MLEYLITEDGLLPPVQTTVPFDAPGTKPTTREEIFAVANTAHLLNQLGDTIAVTEEDAMQARDLFASGREPNHYERQLPGVMMKLNAMLDEYDYSLLEDAHKIRHYVTNRLVEETDNPDPKVRLRAYELLGKITEVGLFTERSEVTIHHQPTESLEAMLREKLERLMPKVIEHPDVKPEDIERAL